MFDEEPDDDPHGQCRHEIHTLRAQVETLTRERDAAIQCLKDERVANAVSDHAMIVNEERFKLETEIRDLKSWIIRLRGSHDPALCEGINAVKGALAISDAKLAECERDLSVTGSRCCLAEKNDRLSREGWCEANRERDAAIAAKELAESRVCRDPCCPTLHGEYDRGYAAGGAEVAYTEAQWSAEIGGTMCDLRAARAEVGRLREALRKVRHAINESLGDTDILHEEEDDDPLFIAHNICNAALEGAAGEGES